MKPLVSLVLGVGLAVVLFIGGFMGFSWLISEEEPHRFANLDGTPLWTNDPVPVNREAQSYERIAAAPVPPVFAAMAVDVPDEVEEEMRLASRARQEADPGLDQTATGAVDPMDLASTAHAHWCSGQYRSYRVEDNSYQPYNGPRRECESPYMADLEVIASRDANLPDEAVYEDIAESGLPAAEPVGFTGATRAANMEAPMDAHVEWCLQRYRSYRLEDNSYQPYGGPRRQCISPFG